MATSSVRFWHDWTAPEFTDKISLDSFACSVAFGHETKSIQPSVVRKKNMIERITAKTNKRLRSSCFESLRASRYRTACLVVLLNLLWIVPSQVQVSANDFKDPQADRYGLPEVPDGFEVTIFAKEPMVRQPCSMAFDARGRLFVGMGPQYRKPTPETPGDSVVILSDTTGDGTADHKQVFATGFNAVQALAWHGQDLWVANAPDLTVVRDLDGDDEADEYVRIYTDLGNLEHGLHGLNWAPDGKLYMSKGNSKGLTLPDRLAPKPFRELWGVDSPANAPDMPEPKVFTKDTYQRSFHDPNDDWGLDGGVLRCDDGGANLEIVSRGFRNPWDITVDSQFNWLGTDNDQTGGDRIIMPFYGAHFGWNHPWSAHWSPEPHQPSAPVSGPLFEGSGTGIIFGDGLKFPPRYRKAFFINDWLNKTTYVWRPEWDGALMRPASGKWEPFVVGGDSLFRPTDLEVGADGALWILGWSRGYGAEWKDGQLTNEGRVYRIAKKDTSTPRQATNPSVLPEQSVLELVQQFSSPLPVHRIDAQDELVHRGKPITQELINILNSDSLTEMQQTWTLWALGRIAVNQPDLDAFFERMLTHDKPSEAKNRFNQRLQAIRILAFRSREAKVPRPLPAALIHTLNDPEPRIRFESVQALYQADCKLYVPQLLEAIAKEKDTTVFYTTWKALKKLCTSEDLRTLQNDSRDAVRRAALLALLESHEIDQAEVQAAATDSDIATRAIASTWLDKVANGGEELIIKGRPLGQPGISTISDSGQVTRTVKMPSVSVVRNLRAQSDETYRFQPSGLMRGAKAYSDRPYKIRQLPEDLVGADFIQTANNDDESQGNQWLLFEALVPLKVMIAVDRRQPDPPAWITKDYLRTDQQLVTDDCTMQIYSRDYPAGPIVLGGNTDAKRESPCANYVVLIKPRLLEKRIETESRSEMLNSTLKLLEQGDVQRGEILFKHTDGAGCIKCHRLTEGNGGFAPNLGRVGSRATVRHLVESMIDPDAVITEGFQQLSVLMNDARVHSGILIEESGISLTLGLVNGNQIVLPKSSIEQRKSRPLSTMPSMASLLRPEQIADLAAYLLTLRDNKSTEARNLAKKKRTRRKAKQEEASLKQPSDSTPPKSGAMKTGAIKTTEPFIRQQEKRGLSYIKQKDRVQIYHDGNLLTEYVFQDDAILRPYFSNLKTLSGLQATRRYPPVRGEDATDHATMHPGLWLAFGDISGSDFWRNRGSVKHRRFVAKPTVNNKQLTFATESDLISPDEEVICTVVNRFALHIHTMDWSLVWDATYRSAKHDFVFGDQEEMGFGARVATSLTEKNGGTLLNSAGTRTARSTWGQPAQWCDYSAKSGNRQVGITLMASPDNFRESWWHNRDYGVFVANPFGRAAMKQGNKSSISIARGTDFRIVFGAHIHESENYVPQHSFQKFLDALQP